MVKERGLGDVFAKSREVRAAKIQVKKTATAKMVKVMAAPKDKM